MSYLVNRYPGICSTALKLVEENPNEHTADVQGISSDLNQYGHCNSSPRMVMWGSHSSQMPVIEGAQHRLIYSGVESSYGEATWKTKMPTDAVVLKTISKFRVKSGSFKATPVLYVIYQSRESQNTYNMLQIDKTHASHQHFGYHQTMMNHAHLRERNVILKDTVFAQSPNLREDGSWAFGRPLVIANMTIPQVTEDGVVLSASAAKWLTSTTVGERTASAGKVHYFLNAYGDARNYKVMPDVGEKIMDSGLLFALREYIPETAAIDTDIDSLMNIDVDTDKLVYAEPNATIEDITVCHSEHNDRSKANSLLVNTDRQLRKYLNAHLDVAAEFVDLDERLARETRGTAKYGFELQAKIRESIAEENRAGVKRDGKNHFKNIRYLYRATPDDEWDVRVKYTRPYVPNIGSKISGMHGDKSIVVDIWEDYRMPTDPVTGRSADVISAGNTIIGRMNGGKPIEQYIHASRWTIQQKLNNCTYEQAEELIAEYLSVISPIALKWLTELSEADTVSYIQGAMKEFTFPLPSDSPNLNMLLCSALNRRWPVHRGPLEYIDDNGVKFTTEEPVLLGEQYMVLSEKNGVDWAAVAGDAKAQIYGPPAKLSNNDKYSYPYRRQPTKAQAEAETRNTWATCGPVIASRTLEAHNNPAMRKQISTSIITADKPSNIECLLSDDMVTPGNSRPALLGGHILMCSGVQYSSRGVK